MQINTEPIKVLDHGFVRLVSYMQPADDFVPDPNWLAGGDREAERWGEERYARMHGWSGDLEVIRNARTSYDAEWRTGEDAGKDAKLMHRLDRDRHTSPFEAMVFTFEVKAPIFVIRQWHRHRMWSYSERSARYAEMPEEFYVPAPALITTQHTSDKQMRTDTEHVRSSDWAGMMQTHNSMSFTLYKSMLEDGVPRELARTVLPLATYTHMFATVDLHNLEHFLQLRLDAHAQYEIRVYAQALLELVRPICPTAIHAFGMRALGWAGPIYPETK